MKLRNPRSGELDAEVEACSIDELVRIVAGARAVQGEWAVLPVAQRADTLRQLASTFRGASTALFKALVDDTGRTAESRLEIDSVANAIERWCDTLPGLLDEYTDSGTRPAIIPGYAYGAGFVPLPVVGVISPWNFPLLLSLIDAVPALLCGCAVVIKPSELTPRFVAPLQSIIADIPALRDVLHFVIGAGDIGEALVDGADMVVFTGSVATGRKVALRSAPLLKPVALELGGKDAAIVCAGADLDHAARAICWGGTVNAGQSCLSIERVYVEASIHAQFLDRLVSQVSALPLNIEDIDSGIGPIISAAQTDVIDRQVQQAAAAGARIECGGEIVHAAGSWYQPTVVSGVHAGMVIMREETFGPVMAVQAAASVDEAVALSNDSEFGLSAAVFAADSASARTVAARLHAGAISINDASLTAILHDGEKDSFGNSGYGPSRMGVRSALRFGRRQSHLINEDIAASPWWH